MLLEGETRAKRIKGCNLKSIGGILRLILGLHCEVQTREGLGKEVAMTLLIPHAHTLRSAAARELLTACTVQ